MLQLNENKQFAFFQRLAFPLRIFLLILVFLNICHCSPGAIFYGQF